MQVKFKLPVDTPDLTKKNLIVGNFIGGVAWGVGSVIGATIIVGILFWGLKRIDFVPVVGDFVGQVLEVTNQKQLEE